VTLGEYFVMDADGAVRGPVDLETWGRFFRDIEGRRVARTEVTEGVEVSTVFLGIDHAVMGGPPELFETMVFRAAGGEECWRYTTHAQALAGHDQVVAALRERRAPDPGGGS
jgi:hypothetical protein